MIRKFREIVNPPYSTKDVLVILGALFILLVIPLTVLLVQQSRGISPRAKQTPKVTKTTTEVLDQSYIPDQLIVRFKPGVDKASKERIYKAYDLSKIKQAKGTEKYHVQLVKVNPKKAEQTIGALSKNKRVERAGFVLIPDSPEVADSNVKGLATQVQAATIQDSMTTPEGTKIESYTNQVTAQEIYNVLKANAASLSGEIGPTLTVRVGDDFRTYVTHSYGGGAFRAVMYLNAYGFLTGPNFDVGHEYGHVFGHYYRHTVWNSSWVGYQKARGIYGDPRLESSYLWRTSEIFAEDYRHLLAAPEAWSEGPYQGNRDIPLATEVPGLQQFLCTTWQGKSSNSWYRCDTGEGDTQAPTASITSPSNGSTVSGLVDVNVTASDNVAVTKVELYVDGSLFAADLTSPYVFSWDTTTTTNSSHTLAAKAYDAAGNSKTSSTVTVTVSNTTSDTQPPVVSITSPTDDQTVSGTITVSATASDNFGVTKTELYVDNGLKGTDTSAPYTFSLDTKTLPNGNHNLEVRAYDAAGNVGYSGVVTVNANNNSTDTTPPTVKIINPPEGTTISKPPVAKIEISASDNVSVTKVEVYIDGSLFATLTSFPYRTNWSTKKYLSGTHLITAKAYDAAGNSSTASITVLKK